MAEPRRIGLREVRALGPREIVWDAAVAGFHARRQLGPAVTYYVFYRTKEGRQRWHKIGRHGAPWTPEKAREEALRILGRVTDGSDPTVEQRDGRKVKTVAELCLAPFFCEPRRRSRLQQTDDCWASWSQGTFRYVAVCARRGRSIACRG